MRREQPESVHDMRVAVRRLRGALQAFDAVLPRERTGGLIDELRWLGCVLGAARDEEVLSDLLTARLAEVSQDLVIGPVSTRIRGFYAPRQAAAHAELVAELDSDRYVALIDALDGLLAAPPLTAAAAERADATLPPAARENAFTYGLLYERDATYAAALPKQAHKTWKRTKRRGKIAWMRSQA